MPTIHEPVLLKEVLSYFDPQPGDNFIDCTFGGGGHSLAILERVKPLGRVLGIDWDQQAVQSSGSQNLILVNNNYKNLKKIIHDHGISKPDGILLDLGLSSDQLGADRGGFGFQSEGPLDLRYSRQSERPTAGEVLRNYSEEELFKIFKEYGEEPLARAVAKKIIASRRLGHLPETAAMLVQLVSEVYKKYFKTPSRRNPATRVFQALRIEVNDEWGNLRAVLPEAVEVLPAGGRLAVISFHSGEDRIVKNFFKQQVALGRIKILTKKPLVAGEDELEKNPRSRSAKMRVAERI